MTLAAALLHDDSLRVDEKGPALEIGLNWYRSLPLSSVETLEVTIDKQQIPREHIQLVINGRTRSLDELHSAWDEEWFVLDPATLRFNPAPALTSGDKIEVSVRLGSRIPYILVGPNTTLEYFSERTRTLTVRQSAGSSAQSRGGRS